MASFGNNSIPPEKMDKADLHPFNDNWVGLSGNKKERVGLSFKGKVGSKAFWLPRNKMDLVAYEHDMYYFSPRSFERAIADKIFLSKLQGLPNTASKLSSQYIIGLQQHAHTLKSMMGGGSNNEFKDFETKVKAIMQHLDEYMNMVGEFDSKGDFIVNKKPNKSEARNAYFKVISSFNDYMSMLKRKFPDYGNKFDPVLPSNKDLDMVAFQTEKSRREAIEDIFDQPLQDELNKTQDNSSQVNITAEIPATNTMPEMPSSTNRTRLKMESRAMDRVQGYNAMQKAGFHMTKSNMEKFMTLKFKGREYSDFRALLNAEGLLRTKGVITPEKAKSVFGATGFPDEEPSASATPTATQPPPSASATQPPPSASATPVRPPPSKTPTATQPPPSGTPSPSKTPTTTQSPPSGTPSPKPFPKSGRADNVNLPEPDTSEFDFNKFDFKVPDQFKPFVKFTEELKRDHKIVDQTYLKVLLRREKKLKFKDSVFNKFAIWYKSKGASHDKFLPVKEGALRQEGGPPIQPTSDSNKSTLEGEGKYDAGPDFQKEFFIRKEKKELADKLKAEAEAEAIKKDIAEGKRLKDASLPFVLKKIGSDPLQGQATAEVQAGPSSQQKGTLRPKFISPSVEVLEPSPQAAAADETEWSLFDYVRPGDFGVGTARENPLVAMDVINSKVRYHNAGLERPVLQEQEITLPNLLSGDPYDDTFKMLQGSYETNNNQIAVMGKSLPEVHMFDSTTSTTFKQGSDSSNEPFWKNPMASVNSTENPYHMFSQVHLLERDFPRNILLGVVP